VRPAFSTIGLIALGARPALLPLKGIPGGWAVVIPATPTILLAPTPGESRNDPRAEISRMLDAAAEADCAWFSYGTWDVVTTPGGWGRLPDYKTAIMDLLAGPKTLVIDTGPSPSFAGRLAHVIRAFLSWIFRREPADFPAAPRRASLRPVPRSPQPVQASRSPAPPTPEAPPDPGQGDPPL
jgi:hypothetical protein